MNNNLKILGIFIGGALTGSLITGYTVKTRYEKLIDEEIQSVKDTYKNRTGITDEFIERKEYRESDLIENCDIEKVAEVKDIKEYNERKKDGIKTDYRKYHKKIVETVTEIDGEFTNLDIEPTNDVFLPPTLVDEEEVGMDGYDMKVLTYYSDGVLADDSDNIIDIAIHIGLDNVKLFDESPGCSTMFVRNERFGIDYEVQRDDMTWSDFATQMGIDPLG